METPNKMVKPKPSLEAPLRLVEEGVRKTIKEYMEDLIEMGKDSHE